MAVLVLGGYGLIGSAIVDQLWAAGAAVVGLGRNVGTARRRWPQLEWRQADLARLTTADEWMPLLAGVDAVVNAAGALQRGLNDNVTAVQDRTMRALYRAAKAAGVRRIIQVSAVGAASDASTEFLRSKARADAALRASGLEYVILRPALVISPIAYGGTALLRGLAAFPAVTPLVLSRSRVQTVWIGDVAEAAVAAVDGRIPSGTEFDLVERPSRSVAEAVALFRGWMGLPPAHVMDLPTGAAGLTSLAADLLGWLGWRSPLRSTALAVMHEGVTGNPEPAPAYLGHELRTLPETLRSLPSGPQEHWFARLWLTKPLIIGGLGLFWMVSGALGLWRMEQAVAVLTDRGVAADLASAAVIAGGLVDLALGAMVFVRPLAGAALKGMLLVSLIYLAGGAILAPDLWVDPLGSMVKVVPAMLLALVGLAVLEAR